MKISKKISAASESSSPVQIDAYGLAEEKIRSAIDSLGEIADEDNFAKERIADLSVVLLDIKSRDKD